MHIFTGVLAPHDRGFGLRTFCSGAGGIATFVCHGSTASAVPPTSTSTAGTGLAIVCTSKTSSLVPPRECARAVRSSRKVSNPTFQPLIGSQEPTPEVLVPVINFNRRKALLSRHVK